MVWVRKGPLQQGAHTIEDKPKRKVRCGIRQGKKTLLYSERANFRAAQEAADLSRIGQKPRKTRRGTQLT
jgi:hypothetical protein